MSRGFAQGRAKRLLRPLRLAFGPAGNAESEDRDERDHSRQHDQGQSVAQLSEQHLRARHDQELAERPAGGDDAEGERPPFSGDDSSDRKKQTSELQSQMRISYVAF